MAWLDEAFHTVRLQTEPAERWSDDPLACLFSEFLVLGLLARGGGVLAHAAALGRGGRTLLALGPSGAGKSTLAAIAAEAGWEVLGDESHILAETGAAEGVRVYGTPWPGTGGLFRNASAPLAGILLLAHGEANRLDPLGGAEGAAHLLSHFFLPAWSGAALERTAAFAGRLAQRIPIHRYAFRPDTSALGPLDALL
jgi:hypothetical protein